MVMSGRRPTAAAKRAAAFDVRERLGLVSLDIALALAFLITWVAPWPHGLLSRDAMADVIGVEFFAIVAALLIGPPVGHGGLWRSLVSARRLVVGAACLVFAMWLGVATGLWWASTALILLILDKLVFGRRLRRRADGTFSDANVRLRYGAETVVRVTVFGLAFGLAEALPWPALGVLPTALDAAVSGGDADMSSLHVPLVAGFLNFTALAALKYSLMPRLRRTLSE